MAPQGSETLTQLIAAAAGDRGRGMTYAELAKKSIDPVTKYQPSPNLLNKIGRGEYVKLNPPLVGAIIAGLGLPPARVHAAAHRQYIGEWEAVDPGLGGGGEDDEVIRVAQRGDATPGGGTGVEEFVRRSREDDVRDDS
ncbi:hypothetical protein ACWERV_17295 [Streptomyces sp. NPDC004031]